MDRLVQNMICLTHQNVVLFLDLPFPLHKFWVATFNFLKNYQRIFASDLYHKQASQMSHFPTIPLHKFWAVIINFLKNYQLKGSLHLICIINRFHKWITSKQCKNKQDGGGILRLCLYLLNQQKPTYLWSPLVSWDAGF